MGDGDSGATDSETLDVRLTPQTMDECTAHREANELGETAATRQLIRAGVRRDRRAERQAALQMTGGFGALLVNRYLFASADAVVVLYIAFVLVWSGKPTVDQWCDRL